MSLQVTDQTLAQIETLVEATEDSAIKALEIASVAKAETAQALANLETAETIALNQAALANQQAQSRISEYESDMSWVKQQVAEQGQILARLEAFLTAQSIPQTLPTLEKEAELSPPEPMPEMVEPKVEKSNITKTGASEKGEEDSPVAEAAQAVVEAPLKKLRRLI